MNEHKWLDCVFQRGAFSGERVVEVRANGSVYVGIVPVGYLKNENGSEVTKNDPAPNQSAIGKVRAQVRTLGEQVSVVFPDGERVIIAGARRKLDTAQFDQH